MEFTQEERNEFAKNLINGVEDGFCKIDPLKTKKSKLELQNEPAYDLRGVPNWMAKPFLKYDSLKYWVLLVMFIVLFALGVTTDANNIIPVGIKLIFCACMLIGVANSLCLFETGRKLVKPYLEVDKKRIAASGDSEMFGYLPKEMKDVLARYVVDEMVDDK